MYTYERVDSDIDIPDSQVKIIKYKGEGEADKANIILQDDDWFAVGGSYHYFHFQFTEPKKISSITTFCGNKEAAIKDIKVTFIMEKNMKFELNYERPNEDKDIFPTQVNGSGITCSEIIYEINTNHGADYTGFNRIIFQEGILCLDIDIKEIDSTKVVIINNEFNTYELNPSIKSRFVTVEMLDFNGGYYIGLNRMFFLDKDKNRIKNQKVVKFNCKEFPELETVTDDPETGEWFAQEVEEQMYKVDLGSETEVYFIEIWFANEENRPNNIKISKSGGLILSNQLINFFKECLRQKAKMGKRFMNQS